MVFFLERGGPAKKKMSASPTLFVHRIFASAACITLSEMLVEHDTRIMCLNLLSCGIIGLCYVANKRLDASSYQALARVDTA